MGSLRAPGRLASSLRLRLLGALVSAMVGCLSACSDDSGDGPGGSSGAPSTSGSGGSGALTSGAPSTGGSSIGGSGAAPGTGGSGLGGSAVGGASTAGTPGTGGGMNGGATNGGAPTGGSAMGGMGSGNAGTMGNAGSGQTGGVAPVIAGGVRWIGRVDVSNAAAPKFAWSGTGFSATVTGDTIAVKLKSDGDSQPIFFQPVIDGMTKDRVSVAAADGEKTVTLGTGLGAGDHVVQLYRETEGKPGFAVSTFLGFASGTPKDPPAYSGRLIEVIGDSISAGYGNLGTEQHPNGSEDPSGGCRFSTQTESAYLTYGAVAARAVTADASIIAASGWGVYSDNGGNMNNVLSALFGNTLGGQGTPAWSFTAKPQAVVINLGTNDFSAKMDLAEMPFATAYKALITTVRSKYPDAQIFCAIGSLLYGTGLTNARQYINGVVTSMTAAGDTKLKVLDFGQQDASKGTGCDWHPNVAENKRMADILTQQLRTSLGW